MMPADSKGSVNSLCGSSEVVATVAATKDGADGGVRLGSQKLRRMETCPYYRTMTMHHHHHRPFSSSSSSSSPSLSSGIVSDDGGGPIRGDVYHDAAIAIDRGGRNMAATALGVFPFTGDQLKELQRQAIIYKYMMAAVPVPSHLLFPGLLSPADLSPPSPTAAPPSSSHHLGGKGSSILSFRFESFDKSGTDPEPWRCKRTDGKKWRCSKDVAPNQKYCDRHMHRGRARSRKPVELNTPPPPPLTAAVLPPIPADRSHPKSSPFEFPNAFACAPSSSYKDYTTTTSVDWVVKQGAADIFGQRSSFFDKRGDSILNGFEDFVKQRHGEECSLFLDLDPLATERPLPERGFIHAWSDSIPEEPTATVSGDRCQSSITRTSSVSNLTLSIAMAGGGDATIDHDTGPIHIGFGLAEMDRSKHVSAGWPNPWSWAAPTPGGPLAEALKSPVSVARGATVADRCGEYGSQPTAASSPSGVLHRGVGSVSDSSDSSSPNLAALSETKHDDEVLPSRG